MGNFCNLHVHSDSSFLDGFSKVEEIAARAAELGQPAVALTDHGECNGHLAFQNACRKNNVHPVLAMEGYYTFDLNKSREEKTGAKDNSHIVLLAKDQEGLKNLWAWSSKAYEPANFYGKPQADLKMMKEYSKGLWASEACLMTEFARRVDEGDEPAAREITGKLLNIFGENFYMELHTWQFMNPQSEKDIRLTNQMRVLNQAKVRISGELGVPLVVVNDAHYARPEQWESHALVWAFNTRNTDQLGDSGQKADWMMSEEDLVLWMSKHGISRSITEEAIRNSYDIAMSCTAEVLPNLEMPRLHPTDREDFLVLEKAVEESFKARDWSDPDAYRARIDKELKVIRDNAFSGYFNIVADYVKAAKTGLWRSYVSPGAKREPLLVGPARGSAAGSMVAYLMGITSVDPVKHGLIFERFINPGRKDFPDIDVDVPQSRRPEIKDYLGARYGHDHVCHIGTRAKSAPRGTLADLCRVMKIGHTDRMAMSRILEEVEDIDDEESVGWDQILTEMGGELAPWVRKYPKLFDKMGEMVGLTRQSGTHASGILVSNKPLLGTLPTRVKNGLTVSQLDYRECEALGAVKLDLLGLRHLDTLMVARQLIQEHHGIWIDYEKFDAEFDDPEIWTDIERGDTIGIFQIETASGSKIAKEFRPRSLIDVADLLSVNRPGVIRAGLLEHYLRRRHGVEAVTYDHPLMEGIVSGTFAILVYQEQLMQACQVLAGFSLAEADDMRKIIGKKQIDKLPEMKEKFVAGCLANKEFISAVQGNPTKMINKIWASFEASGAYLFNKSHAVGYATISSWEVWTKHYYPREYIVALMQTDSENLNRYVREARKRGIKILPPDINRSGQKFTIDGDTIRYGLDAIDGIGESTCRDIEKGRPYKDFADYLARAKGGADLGAATKLIKIGSLESMGTRSELLRALERQRVLDKVSPNKLEKITEEQKDAIWAEKVAKYPDQYRIDIPDFSDEKVIYEIEKELVGNYVTVDPMAKYLKMIGSVCISHPDEIKSYKTNDIFRIGGMVTRIKHHKTKGGKPMAFFAVSWNEEEFDIVAFPESWASVKNILKVEAPVACQVIKLEKGCCLSSLERLDYLLA